MDTMINNERKNNPTSKTAQSVILEERALMIVEKEHNFQIISV